MKQAMNPWRPDDNPLQTRRVNKTLEELAELSIVLARINMQGLQGINPKTGKTNLQEFWEERADVIAQFRKLDDVLGPPPDVGAYWDRVERKKTQMDEWEKELQND